MSKEIDVVKTDLLKAFLRTIEFSKFVISKQYCLVPDDLDPWVKMLSAMEAVESLTAWKSPRCSDMSHDDTVCHGDVTLSNVVSWSESSLFMLLFQIYTVTTALMIILAATVNILSTYLFVVESSQDAFTEWRVWLNYLPSNRSGPHILSTLYCWEAWYDPSDELYQQWELKS